MRDEVVLGVIQFLRILKEPTPSVLDTGEQAVVESEFFPPAPKAPWSAEACFRFSSGSLLPVCPAKPPETKAEAWLPQSKTDFVARASDTFLKVKVL